LSETAARENTCCPTCRVKSSCIIAVSTGNGGNRPPRGFAVHEYQRGQVVFYEGTPALAVYCLICGGIKLQKAGSGREQHVIRILSAGDIMGYRPVLADEPYAATAVAFETTAICTIPRADFIDLMRRSPELSLELLRRLSRELRISEDQMLSQAHETVLQRTARVLQFLLVQSGGRKGDDERIGIPLRRMEIAQMVGTSPETLSRTLRKMGDRGIIKVTRGGIEVQNTEALKAFFRQRR
jgi:CRP-like cAMP-binding protein